MTGRGGKIEGMATELQRAIQSFGAGRPQGERALVVAVIGHAARDAVEGDAGAAAWLLSDSYRFYLELLELPPEWLPKGLDRAALAGMVEAAASRRARLSLAGAATPRGPGPGRGRVERAGRPAPMLQNVA